MRMNPLFIIGVFAFVGGIMNLQAQQAGMRADYRTGGYTFDAEKYKVDVQLQKLKNQPLPTYQPSQPKYIASQPPKTPKVYSAPKYPKDTLVFDVSDFTFRNGHIYPTDGNTGGPANDKLTEYDTLLLKAGPKDKYRSYLFGNRYVIAGLDHSFDANKSISCLLRKTGESDKKYFGLAVNIDLSAGYDGYTFTVNNKGEYKIDKYTWNESTRTIAKNKAASYVPNSINELTILKAAEKLSFLCNGTEVYSVTLEHPWTKIRYELPRLFLEAGVEVCLYGFRNVWYPH